MCMYRKSFAVNNKSDVVEKSSNINYTNSTDAIYFMISTNGSEFMITVSPVIIILLFSSRVHKIAKLACLSIEIMLYNSENKHNEKGKLSKEYKEGVQISEYETPRSTNINYK